MLSLLSAHGLLSEDFTRCHESTRPEWKMTSALAPCAYNKNERNAIILQPRRGKVFVTCWGKEEKRDWEEQDSLTARHGYPPTISRDRPAQPSSSRGSQDRPNAPAIGPTARGDGRAGGV